MWEIIWQPAELKGLQLPQRLADYDTGRLAFWVIRHQEFKLEVPLFVYMPLDPTTADRVVFSIHGRKRNGTKYRNNFIPFVQNKNVFIVAPQFDEASFSNSWAFMHGNMFEGKSLVKLPQEIWTFTIIDRVFQLMKDHFSSLQHYSLFGHSAGAQFAHRFALFSPHAELDSIVAANAGWYTIMNQHDTFPYGIDHLLTDEQITRVLAEPLTIIAGEHDVDDEYVRMTPRAAKQGTNRYERAQYAFHTAKSLADSRGDNFNWRLINVPSLEHSGKQSAGVALPYLLKESV